MGTKAKVAFGVPTYGSQDPTWWVPFARQVGLLHIYDIEFVDVIQHGTMRTDGNRNVISRRFLSTEAEWLFWVDADNINPIASVRRLLDTAGDNRTLVSGLYYTKIENPNPVVYTDAKHGRYRPLGQWERGEIIPVEAAGMNCCLMHRSVLEDIDKNYVTLRMTCGGDIAVHRDDIVGDVFEEKEDETDNKIIDGQWRFRVFAPAEPANVPFFELRFGRTEDMGFFEKARRVGHQLWLDTSVECGHLRQVPVTGKEYREGTNSRHWVRSTGEESLAEFDPKDDHLFTIP
jgi:hypothetical protein